MAENQQQPQDVLREEILADARKQADRALQRARKEANEIAVKASTELETWRATQLETAQTEAQRRTHTILASLPVETGRMRDNRIEALLQSIRDEASQQLDSRTGFDYQQTLVHLSAEALRGMSGTRFSITLAEADRSLLGDAEIEAIKRLANCPDKELEIISDPDHRDAGFIMRDLTGEELWDNRLTQRLERLWPAMRREIGARAGWVEVDQGETP